MTSESHRRRSVEATPKEGMGSLPADPRERLEVLERLWANVVERGYVRAVPCDDEDHEHEREISERPEDMGCCEGAGWVWRWVDLELAVHALLPVLPLKGSWGVGYRVSDHIDPTVVALPEEWVDAAQAVSDLHAALKEAR
jgi:hypothetical protein